MLIFLTTLLAALRAIFRSRADLELENLAVRHQIGVLQRSATKRPKLPFLRARNLQGFDVYLLPFAEYRNAGYILLDLDHSMAGVLPRMRANGHEPSVLLRTSPAISRPGFGSAPHPWKLPWPRRSLSTWLMLSAATWKVPRTREHAITTQIQINQKISPSSLSLVLLLATLGGNASASTTWYVDGVHGNDANTCKSPTTACKTIGHAISLASSGDSIMVAAATHTENLTIRMSLNVLGAGANATILDGGGKRTVVTIPNTSASVILSGITVFHGYAKFGGGVYNSGTLTITNTTISGNGATCAIASAFVPAGGGIYNLGTLMIYNGTISGNGASCHRPVGGVVYAFGGGILNSGTLTIKSSTINGNTTFAGNFFASGLAMGAAWVAAFTTMAP